MKLTSQCHLLQSSSTVRFDPEIIVIAGRTVDSGGQELLQNNFPLMYTVANASVLNTNNETLGQISMEEPFSSHPVSMILAIDVTIHL